MDGPEREEVTRLLIDWSNGDAAALDQLMPMVYAELRSLVGRYLRRERIDHTLQPTALVNEAYLRLVDQRSVRWQNRAHFFGVAAQMDAANTGRSREEPPSRQTKEPALERFHSKKLLASLMNAPPDSWPLTKP